MNPLVLRVVLFLVEMGLKRLLKKYGSMTPAQRERLQDAVQRLPVGECKPNVGPMPEP